MLRFASLTPILQSQLNVTSLGKPSLNSESGSQSVMKLSWKFTFMIKQGASPVTGASEADLGFLGSTYAEVQVSLIHKDICNTELNILWLIWICSDFRNKLQYYWDGKGFKGNLNFWTNNFSPNVHRNKGLVFLQQLSDPAEPSGWTCLHFTLRLPGSRPE